MLSLSKPSSSLVTALLVLGCCCLASISRAAEARGMLEIQIKDHRDAIGDFAKLNITIDAGSFDDFQLNLRNIDGVLKKNQKNAPVKNTVGPVKLSFDVPAKGETILVIDLTVVDLSDHPPRGYELGIRGYELYTNGKLIGKVPPA